MKRLLAAHLSKPRATAALMVLQSRKPGKPKMSSLKREASGSHRFGSHAYVIPPPRPRESPVFSGKCHSYAS